MEIRPASVADLQKVEWLRERIFGGEAMKGISPESRVQMRIALRKTGGQPVEGLFVAVDNDQLVGVVEIETREMHCKPGLAEFRILRSMGIVMALRYMFIWLFLTYRPASHEAYLYNMAIDPSYRRKGLAVKMTNAVEEQSRLYGKKLAVCVISNENKASLALVEKCGYRQARMPSQLVRRLFRRDEMLVRVEKSLLPLG